MILTAENYFSKEAQMTYMGASQFKSFCECEAKAMAEIKGEFESPPTDSMLVGSYIDAHFSNELHLFTAKHPEILTKAGELKAPYQKANEIIWRISQDNVFMQHISGKMQVIMTGVINGVEYKIKIDSLLQDMTVDLKVMKDFEYCWKDGERLPFYEAWGYNYQAAIYQAVRAQNDGEIKPFILAAATKEKEPDLKLFMFDDAYLRQSFEKICALSPRFAEIKKGFIEPTRCGVCDFCKKTKTLKMGEYEIIGGNE